MDTAALVKKLVKKGDNPELVEQIQHEILDDIAAGNYGSESNENIQLLHAIMESDLESNKICQTSQDIIHKICLPLLHKMFLLHTDKTKDQKLIICALMRLYATCFRQVPMDFRDKLLNKMLLAVEKKSNLENSFEDEVPSEGVPDVDISYVIEMLIAVLKASNSGEKKDEHQSLQPISIDWLAVFYKELLVILKDGESKNSQYRRILGILMPSILNASPILPGFFLNTWHVIEDIFLCDTSSSKPCLILCALADWFYPTCQNGVISEDLRTVPRSWEIIQHGLHHTDTLTRKHAMYLLKRVLDVTEQGGKVVGTPCDGDASVFYWSKDQAGSLSTVWRDFILLMETLEETQVHVISPLMPRLGLLIQATMRKQTEAPLLHTSWLITVFQRAFGHESMTVVKWAVEELLLIDNTHCPILEQTQAQFLCGPFVNLLNNTALYTRSTGDPVGSCPSIGQALTKFFNSVHAALQTDEKRGIFFREFLEAMSAEKWAGAPFLYLSLALSHLPSDPLWNQDSLSLFRDLLVYAGRVPEQNLRGALQSSLAKTFINNLDVSSVSPLQFASVLEVLKPDESFKRGTSLWQNCCLWLKEISARNDNEEWSADRLCLLVEKSITNRLKITSEMEKSHYLDEAEPCTITKLLLLMSDAGILGTSEKPLSGLLYPVTDTLGSVNTRAYMPMAKSERALQLLLLLLRMMESAEGGLSGPVETAVYGIAQQCGGEIYTFIRRRLTELSQMQDIESLDLYMEVQKTLLKLLPDNQSQAHLLKLVAIGERLLGNRQEQVSWSSQIQLYSAMAFLASVCDFLTESAYAEISTSSDVQKKLLGVLANLVIAKDLERPQINTDTFIGIGDASQRHSSGRAWGRISSGFLAAQWRSILYLLENSATYLAGKELQLMSTCFDALDRGSEILTITIMQCMTVILPHLLVTGEEKLLEALAISWRKVGDATRAVQLFWSTLEAFVQLAFQDKFLQLVEDSLVQAKLVEYIDCIFELGSERPGVAAVLMSRLLQFWAIDGNIRYAHHYVDIIVQACYFGQLQKKETRFLNELSTYVQSLGNACAANQIKPVLVRDDMQVRVAVVNWVTTLRKDDPEHMTFTLALLRKLMEAHLKLCRTGKARSYSNSLQHRQGHRLVAAILVLEPIIPEEQSLEVFQYVEEALAKESQPSVRCMIEWLAMRLVHRHTASLLPSLLDLLSKMSDLKNAHLCSVLCIAAHVLALLPQDKQETYCDQALKLIVPPCMANHFSVRLHAQAALVKMWQHCKERNMTSLENKHVVISSMVDAILESSKSSKNSQKILDFFFFFLFDPREDYSLETIYHTLPRLMGSMYDEWISVEVFLQADPSGWSDRHTPRLLPLYNNRKNLSQCKPSGWKVRAADLEDESGVTEGDVQKKVIPWRSMFPEEEEEDEEWAGPDKGKKKHLPGGLIVVTSLIDKVPNLGGLCRTSEIFGVSEFVVSNLASVQDRNFQNLCVTADRWIPIKEVRASMLRTYLLEMREAGYTLVGAEQTANSMCLTDYTFSTKTLLLLGNEKEGIPVDLIQLLDTCVEIPQQGIIRSLNVHVSGALLIWEYTRQQMVAHGEHMQ